MCSICSVVFVYFASATKKRKKLTLLLVFGEYLKLLNGKCRYATLSA